MIIAMNTVCMAGFPLDEALATAVDAGFTNIELLAVRGWRHVEPGKCDPQELLARAKKLGFQYSAVHAGGFGASSDEELASSLGYVKSCFDFAKALGAGYIVFTGFNTPAGQTPQQRAETCRRFGQGLKELLPLASASNIPIALENHYNCQVETIEDYERVFAVTGDSPLLGVTLDTGHFTASRIDPVQVAAVLGSKVINVHVKDHIGTESVGLGYGKTDNTSVVKKLRSQGYGGPLTVEIEAHDQENIVRYVHEAFPYMQRLAQL